LLTSRWILTHAELPIFELAIATDAEFENLRQFLPCRKEVEFLYTGRVAQGYV